MIVRRMQLPAIREEEERRSLIQDKEEEEEDDLLIKEPIKKGEEEKEVTIVKEVKVKAFPLQEIWHQFDKQEEGDGQELNGEMVRKGGGGSKVNLKMFEKF